MERDITKALNVLSSISQRHPELHLDCELEDEESIAEEWVEAICDDTEEKLREKEVGLFRIRWGGSTSQDFLYRLEDYEAIADYIEQYGTFPVELALEDRGAY